MNGWLILSWPMSLCSWLLNALNSAEPVLGYFLRYQQSPPERLYPELARLAGSLLTFSAHPSGECRPDLSA